MTYVLFEQRHDVPPNSGALCLDYNWKNNAVVVGEKWEEALSDQQCSVIVTGLTPALTRFIFDWIRTMCAAKTLAAAHWTGATLTLLHYNRKTDKYQPQTLTI